MNKRNITVIVAMLIIVGFFYVWPGIFRYKYYDDGSRRTDLLNGKMYERYYPYHNEHWQILEKCLENGTKYPRPTPDEWNEYNRYISEGGHISFDSLVNEYLANGCYTYYDNWHMFRREKEAIYYAFDNGYTVDDVAQAIPQCDRNEFELVYKEWKMYVTNHRNKKYKNYMKQLQKRWAETDR